MLFRFYREVTQKDIFTAADVDEKTTADFFWRARTVSYILQQHASPYQHADDYEINEQHLMATVKHHAGRQKIRVNVWVFGIVSRVK